MHPDLFVSISILSNESDVDNAPFREWYGKLSEVRGLINYPVLLITAAATKSARKTMQKKLTMVNCLEIIDNPDRTNIKVCAYIQENIAA